MRPNHRATARFPILTVAIIGIFTAVFSSAAHAGGENPEVRFVDLDFSLSEFRSLSKRELGALSQNDDYFNHFRIEGFSDWFGVIVLKMAINQRGRTRILLRDMSRLTGTAERRARLREEIKWVEDLKRRIDASIARLKTRPSNVLNDSIMAGEEQRFVNLENYRQGLQRWVNNITEGTR